MVVVSDIAIFVLKGDVKLQLTSYLIVLINKVLRGLFLGIHAVLICCDFY